MALLRRFTLGSGPLQRGSDRVEGVSRVVVLLFVLLSLPVAPGVWSVVRSDLSDLAREQAAERTPVSAVVTADPDVPGNASPRTRIPVPAQWASPGGAVVTGEVLARPTTRAGDTLTQWTASDGRRVDEPMTAAEVRRSSLVLVGVGWAGGVGAVVLGHVGLCRVLERQRNRRWTRGWARVEPTWSRRVP